MKNFVIKYQTESKLTLQHWTSDTNTVNCTAATVSNYSLREKYIYSRFVLKKNFGGLYFEILVFCYFLLLLQHRSEGNILLFAPLHLSLVTIHIKIS